MLLLFDFPAPHPRLKRRFHDGAQPRSARGQQGRLFVDVGVQAPTAWGLSREPDDGLGAPLEGRVIDIAQGLEPEPDELRRELRTVVEDM